MPEAVLACMERGRKRTAIFTPQVDEENRTFNVRLMKSIYRPSDFANQSLEKDVSWLKAELTFGTGGRPSLSKCNASAVEVAIRAEGANLA